MSVSGISISGSDAGNYNLLNTTANATADITARDLTVTAHGVDKVYDGNTAATVTLSTDKISGDTVTPATPRPVLPTRMLARARVYR